MIPESNHAITVSIQEFGSSVIVGFRFEMLRSVQLNNELPIDATEIDYVRSDWMLAAKLETAEPACAQVRPQEMLGVGLRTSEPACLIAFEAMPLPLVR